MFSMVFRYTENIIFYKVWRGLKGTITSHRGININKIHNKLPLTKVLECLITTQ
jgi:hypothetical protein